MGIKELCIIAQDTTSYGIDLYRQACAFRASSKKLLADRFPVDTPALPFYPDRITDRLLSVIRRQLRILLFRYSRAAHLRYRAGNA